MKYYGGLGKGGTATMTVDGKQVVQGRIEPTIPFRISADETLDIGEDTGLDLDAMLPDASCWGGVWYHGLAAFHVDRGTTMTRPGLTGLTRPRPSVHGRVADRAKIGTMVMRAVSNQKAIGRFNT